MLKWNDGERNGTALAGFLDLPKGLWPDMAIPKLEAAAGVKGDWDWEEETGMNWWGLVGTFKGVTFTVYTHKSGTIKIGAHDGFLGIHPAESLDLDGLKAALLAVVTASDDEEDRPRKRKLSRSERLDAMADAGIDTWDNYNEVI